MPKLQARAADVQASLWVLGRGGFADALGEEQWLDLSAVDLRLGRPAFSGQLN
jgi:hypothetical protein